VAERPYSRPRWRSYGVEGVRRRWRHTLAILQPAQDHAPKNSVHAAEQRRNAARKAWFKGQLNLDPMRIVFIDETAANTKMARLYGLAPRANDAARGACLSALIRQVRQRLRLRPEAQAIGAGNSAEAPPVDITCPICSRHTKRRRIGPRKQRVIRCAVTPNGSWSTIAGFAVRAELAGLQSFSHSSVSPSRRGGNPTQSLITEPTSPAASDTHRASSRHKSAHPDS
jgi:hypothetical protein